MNSRLAMLMGGLSALAFTTGAFAADLPARTAPIAPIAVAPIFTWSGFYIGANIGYSFNGDSNARTVGTPAFLTLVPAGIVPGELDTGEDGFIGGVQVGYNYQFGQFVAGVEADIQFLEAGNRTAFIGAPVLGTRLETFVDSDIDYLGTLRARLGYAADRLLIYATGGLAFGEVSVTAGVNGVQAPGLVWSGRSSEVQYGWTAGGGVEYAFTDNLTVKAEYLYYDLGDETVQTVPNAAAAAAVPGVAYDTRVETNGHIVRVGLNYKF